MSRRFTFVTLALTAAVASLVGTIFAGGLTRSAVMEFLTFAPIPFAEMVGDDAGVAVGISAGGERCDDPHRLLRPRSLRCLGLRRLGEAENGEQRDRRTANERAGPADHVR